MPLNYLKLFDSILWRVCYTGISFVRDITGTRRVSRIEYAALGPVPAKLRVPGMMHQGLNFTRGQKMHIRVPVVGRPMPKVSWAVDGEVIERSEKYEVTCTDSSATLVVHDAEKTDSGSYSLHVENELGQDFVSFPVTVTGWRML